MNERAFPRREKERSDNTKRHALADFIVELTCTLYASLKDKEDTWRPISPCTLHTDGSSSIDGMGVGLVLTSLDGGESLRYSIVLTFKETNNEEEYEALITDLRLAKGVGVASLNAYCDSQLVEPSQGRVRC